MMQKKLADALAKLARLTGHRDPFRLQERDLPKLPLFERHGDEIWEMEPDGILIHDVQVVKDARRD